LLGLVPSRQQAEPAAGIPHTVQQAIAVCHALLSERGEVSGVRLASDALRAYQSLDGPARRAFFDRLVGEFSPNPEEVGRAGNAYCSDPSAENLSRLQRTVEPPRQELFRRLNVAPGGTGALIQMRSQLLRELGGNPQWSPIELDLAHLLGSWFNRGFLVLERIDWRTSALILEKLVEYEAVHQIQGWRDLRRRLEADRRCYAFFHPALPNEPIIFIEVALTRGMREKVQPLLDPNSPVVDPASADCAMFYSITNCQEGLRGISFGSLLIKKVAEDLGREFPRLRKFATVSPVPGFRKWLAEVAATGADDPRCATVTSVLARMEAPNWPEVNALSVRLQREIRMLCAYYLVYAKQGNEPLDPVARFHLKNGARLERLNWLGDTSPAGIQRSAGLMVNYVYNLRDVERNHESYKRDYKVAALQHIEWLAKQSSFGRADRMQQRRSKVSM
jgi:malonyl-CoA decarboxylase